ncbi:dihydrodipicolinate synthase family protein [candidate division KSB1 bacterium]|nr:dihydrodipicolinate synthase family protein [candidate division KSB1 bacterium]
MKTNMLATGVYVASLTPLKADHSIDHTHLIRHCKWLLKNGVTGILLMGTTGEANSFSRKERMVALEAIVASGIPAKKLLVGTGCCAVPDTVTLTKHALDLGVQNVLVLPPFYYKNVSDDGIFDFFDRVIQEVEEDALRIYLYHFPKMTGLPFSADLIARFIEHFPQQIVGIKDSGGDWQHMQMLKERFPDFQIFAGSETFLSQIMEIGGAGCISASANLSCFTAAKLYATVDPDERQRLQDKLNALRSIIEGYPVISVLKQVMSGLEKNENWLHLRPPQVALSAEDVDKLLKALEEIHFPADYFI